MPPEQPIHLNTDLSKLTAEQLVNRCELLYTEAKPVQDRMVDIAVSVTACVREIYRRKFTNNLPGVPIKDEKIVLSIGCNINPTVGIPEINKRLQAFQEQGVEITRIGYDQVKQQFNLYTFSE